MASVISDKSTVRRAPKVPALVPGDRLSQAEFHRRYEQYPRNVRFELISGVVYKLSRVTFDHGTHSLDVVGLLGLYEASTPGVAGASNVTVVLGDTSEPQPDAVLCILPEYGGQAFVRDKYLTGPPELIIETAVSSSAYDLRKKRSDYCEYGVLEYMVVCVREKRIRWFDLKTNIELPIDADQVVRSRVFPGLWIGMKPLFDRDSRGAMQILQQGLASPEHAAFVKHLAARKSATQAKAKLSVPKAQPRRKKKDGAK